MKGIPYFKDLSSAIVSTSTAAYSFDYWLSRFVSRRQTDSSVIGVFGRETSCKTNWRPAIIRIIFVLNNYNLRSLARIASDIPTFIRRHRQTWLYSNIIFKANFLKPCCECWIIPVIYYFFYLLLGLSIVIKIVYMYIFIYIHMYLYI